MESLEGKEFPFKKPYVKCASTVFRFKLAWHPRKLSREKKSEKVLSTETTHVKGSVQWELTKVG